MGKADHEGEVGTRLEGTRVHPKQSATRHDPETRKIECRDKRRASNFFSPRVTLVEFARWVGGATRNERVWSIEYSFKTNKNGN